MTARICSYTASAYVCAELGSIDDYSTCSTRNLTIVIISLRLSIGRYKKWACMLVVAESKIESVDVGSSMKKKHKGVVGLS
jgi:hypothetical protein